MIGKISRQQILAYLAELGQVVCHDETNQETSQARNFLRNQCLPEVRKQLGGAVDGSILRLAQQAQAVDALLLGLCQDCDAAVVSTDPNCLRLDRRELVDRDPLLIARWLIEQWDRQRWPRKDMTQTRWQSICEQLTDLKIEQGVWVLPGAIEFRVDEWRAEFRAQDLE